MNLRHTGHRARAGFTLVEIMIVLVIIVILASLLSAAVIRAVGKSREVRNRSEIAQLASALETFKQKFGFYPPSRIKLCEVYGQYGTNPQDSVLDADSVQYLTRMFPQCLPQWQSPGIDWDGSGSPSPPQTLEGDQCLVFFLGGLQTQAVPPGVAPGCIGFSTNPRDPAARTPDRIGPFYEFIGVRLVIALPNPAAPGTVPIHSAAPFYHTYADIFATTNGLGVLLDGSPYAFHSSYKQTNGYNRYFAFYNNSDCATLGVSPYYEGPGRYLNPNSFQIISAGANKRFGPGSGPPTPPWPNPWSPVTASSFYPDGPATTPGGAGRDDQSNFYDTLLGVETK